MKIVVAIDSYKGCMSSRCVAAVVAEALQRVRPDAQVKVVPVSDGGEGMLEAFMPVVGGHMEQVVVHGPEYDTRVAAQIGFTSDGETALIEMAQASGLVLSRKKQVMKSTSYGTGELIRYAVQEKGCRRLVVGLGGSACSDGGAGMLVAMGLKLWDNAGNSLLGTPEELGRAERIDDTELLRNYAEVECQIASDVGNPLCGSRGAAQVFAPQKGASPNEVRLIEAGLQHWSWLVARSRRVDYANHPGAGAAGGVGFALMSYLSYCMESGAACLFRHCSMESLIADADLVITGEGSSDAQTLMGKLPYQVLCLSQKHRVPVWLLSGKLSDREVLGQAGFARLFQVSPPDLPLEQAVLPNVATHHIRQVICHAFAAVQESEVKNK